MPPQLIWSGTVFSVSINRFDFMDFQTSELTPQVAQTARDFAQQHIKPHVMEWDESQEFPLHIFKEMGKLGLMGVLVPEEYGGAGLLILNIKP